MTETTAPSILKIGLIVDSARVSKYTYELISWIQAQPNMQCTHLLVQELPQHRQPMGHGLRLLDQWLRSGACGIVAHMLAALLARLEYQKLKRSVYADHFTTHDVSALVPSVVRIYPAVSKTGIAHRFIARDIEKVRALNFDLLLRAGSGILRGDILQASRFGVLSFHHGDNRVNRGIPAAFWEVLRQEPTTGFIIQQLTDELDGGNVIFRGAFPTQRYWLRNQAMLYTRSYSYMRRVLSGIAERRCLPSAESSLPYYNPLFRAPGILDILRYVWLFIQYKSAQIWQEQCLGRRLRWSVAYSFSGWRSLVMWKAVRIANPEDRFLADPFVIARDGAHYCFVEDYDYRPQRGKISVYRLGRSGAEEVGVALEEPFHLSFPYLFEFQGKLYMVPESARARDIRLYECVSFPLEWKLKRVLMRDVSAVDSMIFSHEGRWWMLTNINPVHEGDRCSELFAFYTDDPVEGEWKPHALNPVIIDPLRARNGGILHEGESTYRVVQRQGFVHYGASAAIKQIVRLDPEHFEESLVCDIAPNFFPRLKGTHHLHSNGTVTAFDFVERVRLD